jgi:hypothetical protein
MNPGLSYARTVLLDSEFRTGGSLMDIDREDMQRDDDAAVAADQSHANSGLPGGGQGRRDETGKSGVYPVSDMQGASGDAPVVGEMGWGQVERGAERYNDSGSSEITVAGGMAIPGEGGVSGNVADIGRDAGASTSQASQPPIDPSDPATDPLSGQAG